MTAIFVGESRRERRMGWSELTRLEQKPASPGLEHLVGPPLTVALAGLETVIRDGERVRVGVQDAEDLAAPHVSQPEALVIASIDAFLVCEFDELLRRSEVVLRVLDRTLREVQRERGSDVAGRPDGGIRQRLHRPCLV